MIPPVALALECTGAVPLINSLVDHRVTGRDAGDLEAHVEDGWIYAIGTTPTHLGDEAH